MASLGEMIVKILGDTSQFDTSVDKSGKTFKSFQETLLKGMTNLSSSFKQLDGEAALWGNSTDILKQKQKLLKDEMSRLISEGFDPTGKETQKLMDEYYKLGNEIENLEKKQKVLKISLKDVGEIATKVGSNLTKFVTLPLIGLGVASIKSAADFETSMNRVRAISGASGKDFEKLQKQARELGETTQFTASEAADAMAFLAMAGFDVNKIYDVMPDTLKLAAAAQLDMGSAADIVTNIMAGFGMEADQLGGAVDVLTKAFTSSNTDLTQLGVAMKYVGPVANSMGVSIEETAAAVGILSNAGLQASMAGTGLRSILSDLAIKSKKLGLDIFESNGKMKPLADVLSLLEARGLTTSEAMTIFGERAGPAMQVLLESGSGALRKLTSDLKDSAGVAGRIATVQMEGFNGQLKYFQSVVEESAISIGNILIPILTDLVKNIRNIFDAFNKLDESQKNLILTVVAVVASIGPLLLIIGKVITAISAIQGAIEKLGTAKAGTIGLVILAIAALVTITIALVDAFKRAKEEKENLDKVLSGGTTGEYAKDLETVNKELEKLIKRREELNRFKDDPRARGAIDDKAIASLDEEINKLQTIKNQIIDTERGRALNQRAQENLNNQVNKELETQESINNVLKSNADITKKYTDARKEVLDIINSEKSEYDKIQDQINKLSETPWASGELEKDRLKAIEILREQQREAIREELDDELNLLEEKKAIQEEYTDSFLEEQDIQKNAAYETYQRYIENGISQRDAQIWLQQEITKIDDAILEKKEKDIEEQKRKQQELNSFILNTSIGLFNSLSSISSLYYGNQLALIDAELQATLKAAGLADKTALESAQEKLRIAEESGNKEEIIEAKKAVKKAQIEQDFAIKKHSLQKKAFDVEKGLKISQIAIDTAMGIVKIWSELGVAAPILAGGYTAALLALGGIQAGLVAGQEFPPLQLADGGIAMPRSGGVSATIAEAGVPEAVIPLDRIGEVLNNIGGFNTSGEQMIHLTTNIDSKPILDLIFSATKNKQVLISSGAIV